MRIRENQFVVEILLLIIISSIVVFTCINLMDIVDMFRNTVESTFIPFSVGF